MAFKDYLCWETRRVREVMNTNAELVARDVFLAVHSEYPLITTSPTVGPRETAPQGTIEPHEFLRQFLSPDRSHVQVAVLGTSGAGKSHFIRWMEFNIGSEPGRLVISIPRSGISLRGIIERVLALLPPDQAQPYRDRLNQAGDDRGDPTQLKERLLDEIALSVGRDAPNGPARNLDVEGEIIRQLPNLFHDPYLRGVFRQGGGVIERLVQQVLSSSSQYVPVDSRREFSISDLPLTGFQLSKMSEPAQLIVDFLRTDPTSQSLAIEIINRNLDKAIAQMLNFTGDRLIQLLSDVRINLGQQDQELVLLIEDLSRLQGLDLALLEALIIEGKRGEVGALCPIRWAAAATTGYYDSPRVPDTVKTRMNFVLHMDLPTGGLNPLIGPGSIVSFASKYLNAVRIALGELNTWAATREDERGEPPKACDTCPHLNPCHETFGAVDGIGLYPFNRTSLLNMLGRLDPNLEERFNPRILVKDVLAEVLGTFGKDLEDDRFPAALLLSQMGGGKLPPLLASELRRFDPEQAERQLTVLELWGSKGNTVLDLPETLYTAFGLQKPAVSGARAEDEHMPDEPGQRLRPRPVDRRLDAIRAWGNGVSMQDDLLNYIRPLLFDSILSHIDWDRQQLVQVEFAQPTSGHFRRDSISFRGQLTQPATRAITLQVPIRDGADALREAEIGLEGLYQFAQQGDWGFPDAPRLLETLAGCLDEWSEHVLKQLRRFPAPVEQWDPTASAVEVLALGAVLGGRPTSASASIVDGLNALFEDWPEETTAQSPEWRALYQRVRKEQPKLRNIALARATGSKGGRQGPFVDPSRLLPPLRQIRRRWTLTKPPLEAAATRGGDYMLLAGLHARITTELPQAAKAEWQRRTSWVEDWRSEVPEPVARKDVVIAVSSVLDLAVKHGIAFDPRLQAAVRAALSELEGVQLDEALRSAAALKEATDPVQRLPELGRDRGGNAIAAVAKFLPAVRRLLDELEVSVSSSLEQRGQGAKDIQEYQERIASSLAQLTRDLGVIGGTDAHPS